MPRQLGSPPTMNETRMDGVLSQCLHSPESQSVCISLPSPASPRAPQQTLLPARGMKKCSFHAGRRVSEAWRTPAITLPECVSLLQMAACR